MIDIAYTLSAFCKDELFLPLKNGKTPNVWRSPYHRQFAANDQSEIKMKRFALLGYLLTLTQK
jgi:hypothetical protein